jgi:tRNA 5-methylaminomethyl-2-thiouridine biosynthesis bifunctional protein
MINTPSALLNNDEAFLTINNLDARWSSLKDNSTSIFVIADIDFDDGRQFFRSASLWKERSSQHNATLHYVAFAERAMSKDQLQTLSKLPVCYHEIIDELQRVYPTNQPGTHRLWFPKYRIALTLIFGHLNESLKSNSFYPDCWYLNFSRSTLKKPDCFNATLKSIVSTFVRGTTYCGKNLGSFFSQQVQAIGFDCITIPLIQSKDKITAGKAKEITPLSAQAYLTRTQHRFPPNRPWYNQALAPRTHYTNKEQAIVIGAGMAGAWTARTLAERGMKVVVVEKSNEIAASASGNPVGILYVKPGTKHTKATNMAMLACTNANARMLMLNDSTSKCLYDNCGVLQLLNTDLDIDYAKKLLQQDDYPVEIIQHISQEGASNFANSPLTSPALLFSKCGRVFPKQLCTELLRHPNIELVLGFEASNLEKNTAANTWQLESIDKRALSGTIIVIAAAMDTLKLRQTSHLPLKAIRGQITVADTPAAYRLNTVLCGDGYAARTADNQLCFGASFVLSSTNTDIKQSETLGNIQKLNSLSSYLHKNVITLPPTMMVDRASIRATTPDYLPIVGPIADNQKIKSDFFHLTKDSNYRFSSLGSYFDGLYVNVGHGSKGLTTSPLAAEIISDYIFNAPFSIDTNIIEALHPTRFTIRALVKNRIKKG